MTARVEQAIEAVDASKERRESKSITLLRLILDSLPEDKNALLKEYKIELIEFSKKAGLKDTEIGPFLTSVTGLVIRTSHAGKIKGPAEFQFDSGYITVGQAIESIETYLPKRVNGIIRPKRSVYRGPR